MTTTQRIRKVINWLIFCEYAANERELAELLGYQKSSFSQIVNNKRPLSDKFIYNLCKLDDNINQEWVKTGKGELFKDSVRVVQNMSNNQGTITNNIDISESSGNTTSHTTNNYSDCCNKDDDKLLEKSIDEIAEQRKIVAKSQEQIDRLITLLENKND